MKKINVTFEVYEETLLKLTGAHTLEEGINQVLGWMHDGGIFATEWSFVEE